MGGKQGNPRPKLQGVTATKGGGDYDPLRPHLRTLVKFFTNRFFSSELSFDFGFQPKIFLHTNNSDLEKKRKELDTLLQRLPSGLLRRGKGEGESFI